MQLRKRKILEKDIEEQILVYLNSLPGCFAFKVVTSGFYNSSKRIYQKNRSRFVIPGCSDVIGVFRGGFFAVEVKTPTTHRSFKKRPTELNRRQMAFMGRVQVNGGRAIVASTIEHVIELIKGLA
jgi:penicillin-binding protein-related factor A (putative recombinase)